MLYDPPPPPAGNIEGTNSSKTCACMFCFMFVSGLVVVDQLKEKVYMWGEFWSVRLLMAEFDCFEATLCGWVSKFYTHSTITVISGRQDVKVQWPANSESSHSASICTLWEQQQAKASKQKTACTHACVPPTPPPHPYTHKGGGLLAASTNRSWVSILPQGQMCLRLRMTCSLSAVQVLWHCDVGDGHAGSSAVSGTVQWGGGQVCQRGSLHGGAPEVSTQSVSRLGALESFVCVCLSRPFLSCEPLRRWGRKGSAMQNLRQWAYCNGECEKYFLCHVETFFPFPLFLKLDK